MNRWQKRAVELSIQTVVVAVIALIVLVIVILIFRGQIGKTSLRIFGIGEQAAMEANATDRCESMFNDRRCMSACVPNMINDSSGKIIRTIYYGQVPGKWSDCDSKQLPSCCQPIA